MSILISLLHDESGATAIEYALIASLIAVAIISGARSLGTSVNAKLNAIAVNVSGAR